MQTYVILKNSTFSSVYNMGQRPPYVDVLNNRCDRAAICKIRISAHPLMIERGRHLNIPRPERYCLLCKSIQIEDENFFSYIVKKFNTQRNIFNEKISNILENASYKNANNKISFLFNNKSYSILRLTSFHIKLFEYKKRFAIIIIAFYIVTIMICSTTCILCYCVLSYILSLNHLLLMSLC